MAKNRCQKEEDEMLTNNSYSVSEGEFDVICNVVFFLTIEYDTITKITEEEYDGHVEEIVSHKPP